MKKAIATIIMAVLIIGTAATSYAAGYSDIKSTNWAYEAIHAVSERAIIKGYPDGSFRPEDTVTYGEFIKMALIADTGEDPGNARSGHWAENYYDKALELAYFTNRDITKSQLKDKIPRRDMALIASSILGDVKIENYDEIQQGIQDITYQTKHEYDITKSYAFGVLTGYTDSTFRPEKTLSRAEAATVIYRLVDESKRVLPGAEQGNSGEGGKPIRDVITNYQSFYSSNGYFDDMLAAAETYEFDQDGASYGMVLMENRGTRWIEIPPAGASKLGNIYLMKDNKIVESCALSPTLHEGGTECKSCASLSGLSPAPIPWLYEQEDGSLGSSATYKSDITKIDYIVGIKHSNHHATLVANPFKQ